MTIRKRKLELKALKIALSAFLLYHLATVLLMPNGSSLTGRKLSRYFSAYANTLGFNTTWQFFSPGPSPMFYLEYEPVYNYDDEPDSGPFSYPPKREGFAWSDSWNRRLFGMRFFALHPGYMERFFVPFLCRQYEGAIAINIRSVIDQVEDLERVGMRSDLSESTVRVDLPSQEYACPEKDGGEGV